MNPFSTHGNNLKLFLVVCQGVVGQFEIGDF